MGKSEENENIPVNMDGWNWFKDQSDAAIKATAEETGLSAQELDYHFEKCFKTKSGQIVLDHLQRMQDNYRDFDPELGFYNGASFGFWRSGQKSIVRYLKLKARGAKQ